MKNFFLTLSGFIFGLIAVLHLLRYLMKWGVTIGGVVISLKISLWACLATLVLSLGCFLAGGKK